MSRGKGRSSKNPQKNTSMSGPSINATSYRGPIIDRNQINGNDSCVINQQLRVIYSVPTTPGYAFFNFSNSLDDIVTLSGLSVVQPTGQVMNPQIYLYQAYRILGIEVRFTPNARYLNPEISMDEVPPQSAFVVLVRSGNAGSITSFPANFNEVIIQPGVREVPLSDPWCTSYEYSGSKGRPVVWRANSLEDMDWRNTGDEANTTATGGIHIGAIFPTIGVSGYFLVSWRIQLKNLVGRVLPSPVSMDTTLADPTPVQSTPPEKQNLNVSRFTFAQGRLFAGRIPNSVNLGRPS